MKTLFIDACPRRGSRTRALAEVLLNEVGGELTQLHLTEEELPVIDEAATIRRMEEVERGAYAGPLCRYAKQFAEADCIVIAAPFWDLSFPALLKRYLEAIMVTGLTFRYSEEGYPIGLCRAEKLYYVTTAGGPIFDDAYGFGYVRTLAQAMLGIPECVKFAAENLDIVGADVEALLQEARRSILEHVHPAHA